MVDLVNNSHSIKRTLTFATDWPFVRSGSEQNIPSALTFMIDIIESDNGDI